MESDRLPLGAVRGLASLRLAHKVALEGRVVLASLSSLLVLTVALAIAGRVGQADLSHRVLLWITCAVVCWPLCHALGAVILYLTRSLPPSRIALAATCGTFFFTLLCTAVAYTAHGLFYPANPGQVAVLSVYVNVTLVAVIASAIMHFVVCQMALTRQPHHLQSFRTGSPVPDAVVPMAKAPEVDQVSWFFERLEPELGRDIVCLRVSGHYLNVATTEGSCRVLLPLADAVSALGDLGMQVHRSHWVAHRHILGMVRRGHRTMLRVTEGREIPVSRSRVADVRRAVRRSSS